MISIRHGSLKKVAYPNLLFCLLWLLCSMSLWGMDNLELLDFCEKTGEQIPKDKLKTILNTTVDSAVETNDFETFKKLLYTCNRKLRFIPLEVTEHVIKTTQVDWVKFYFTRVNCKNRYDVLKILIENSSELTNYYTTTQCDNTEYCSVQQMITNLLKKMQTDVCKKPESKITDLPGWKKFNDFAQQHSDSSQLVANFKDMVTRAEKFHKFSQQELLDYIVEIIALEKAKVINQEALSVLKFASEFYASKFEDIYPTILIEKLIECNATQCAKSMHEFRQIYDHIIKDALKKLVLNGSDQMLTIFANYLSVDGLKLFIDSFNQYQFPLSFMNYWLNGEQMNRLENIKKIFHEKKLRTVTSK